MAYIDHSRQAIKRLMLSGCLASSWWRIRLSRICDGILGVEVQDVLKWKKTKKKRIHACMQKQFGHKQILDGSK